MRNTIKRSPKCKSCKREEVIDTITEGMADFDAIFQTVYEYSFTTMIDLENAEDLLGMDTRSELYKQILEGFKSELHSKIYGVDKEEALKRVFNKEI